MDYCGNLVFTLSIFDPLFRSMNAVLISLYIHIQVSVSIYYLG